VKSLAREAAAAARRRMASAGRRLAARAAAQARGAAGAFWPPRARHHAWLLALGTCACGLFGMAFQSGLAARLPSPVDWRAAAALVARDARPGDAVALQPHWAERARELFPASLPVLAFPRYAAEDLLGVRRVWLVSAPAAPRLRTGVEDDLTARAAGLAGPERLGALEVTRLDLRAPSVPVAFLPDRLATAVVAVAGRACALDAGGVFRCREAPGAAVTRAVREVDFLPRPCLVVTPAGPAALAVTFPAVPLGRTLRGHLGVVGDAALEGEDPVRLVVAVDGRPVGAVEAPPGEPGWFAFEADTSREAGRAHEVALTVESAAGERRPVCVDAYALP
jgi:hypothetical protein